MVNYLVLPVAAVEAAQVTLRRNANCGGLLVKHFRPFVVLLLLFVLGVVVILGLYPYLADAGCPADMHHAQRWVVKFLCEAKAADAALVFFTYGLMVATLWLAWATLKLWQAGENQLAFAVQSGKQQGKHAMANIAAARLSAEAAQKANEIASSTARKRLRAWVFASIKEARGGDSLVSLGMLHLNFVAVNYGDTPAQIVGLRVKVSPELPKDTGRDETGLEDVPNTLILGSRDKHGVATVPLYHKGANVQFVMGCIEYTDIFGDLHRSWFCFSVDVPTRNVFLCPSKDWNAFD